MKKPGAMMWYPEAWLSSPRVAAMDPVARSGYFDILCHIWLAGGSLPDSDEQLRACARLERRDWKKHRDKIVGCLTFRDGRVTQGRLLEEYERTVELQERRRKGGEKGAKKRWQSNGSPNGLPNRSPIGSANGSAMQTETETETETYQQQQAAASAAADVPFPVLDAVQLAFPTARRGEKWELELAGVRPDEHAAVAELIRRRPEKSARTPVVLVREAVAEVRSRRTREAALAPTDGAILETLTRARDLALKGESAALQIVREYAASGPPGVREIAAAALQEIGQ